MRRHLSEKTSGILATNFLEKFLGITLWSMRGERESDFVKLCRPLAAPAKEEP